MQSKKTTNFSQMTSQNNNQPSSQMTSQYTNECLSQIPMQLTSQLQNKPPGTLRTYAQIAANRPGAFTGSHSPRFPVGAVDAHAGLPHGQSDPTVVAKMDAARKVSLLLSK